MLFIGGAELAAMAAHTHTVLIKDGVVVTAELLKIHFLGKGIKHHFLMKIFLDHNTKMEALRQFVAETSRWQGFRVKNFNCIPANARISTSVCYKAPMNEVFAAIRDAGVTLYESKGMVSFCDPDKEYHNSVAQANYPEKRDCCSILTDVNGGFGKTSH